ncbi:MAG: phosphoglycerate mutase family protein, partial [Limnobacter sp.]|nr:phosphoglycerate mutase family protein [Limnobacter sp.]
QLLELFARHQLVWPKELTCSVSLRSWQTARLSADAIEGLRAQALKINSTDQLCERSVGALANLTQDQIQTVLSKDPRVQGVPENWKIDPDFRLPVVGAESLKEAGFRVAQYLVNYFAQFKEPMHGIPVIVGHGASIRHAAVQLGLLDESELALLSMHHALPMLWVRSDCLRGWTLKEGEWKKRHSDKHLD